MNCDGHDAASVVVVSCWDWDRRLLILASETLASGNIGEARTNSATLHFITPGTCLQSAFALAAVCHRRESLCGYSSAGLPAIASEAAWSSEGGNEAGSEMGNREQRCE
ncbi:unnamed protein product [Cercospora beticola]|nr:unnamed protein product [Cercospora beticola]